MYCNFRPTITPADHNTSVGGTLLCRGYQLDLVYYEFETILDFCMFFDMRPCMVWVWGCVFKLDVVDHALQFPSGHQPRFMERDTWFFLSYVHNHHPADHDTVVGGTSLGIGYGSFEVGVISSI